VDRGVQEVVVGPDQVVLMAPEGVPAEVVDRVVVDRDFLLEAKFVNSPNDLPLSGAVVRYQVFEGTAFCGGVLQMRTDRIDVEARPVHQEPAASRRLEDVVARMQVDRPQLHLVEDVVLDLLDHRLEGAERLVRNQAAEFRLNSENPLAGSVGHGLFYAASQISLSPQRYTLDMRIGEFQEMVAVKETDHGYRLGDEHETVLLPRSQCPKGLRYGHKLNVFVYTDSEDRPVATLKKPKAVVGEFAAMRVVSAGSKGAFLDWGLDKDLFCPIREQPVPMRVGETHVVRVYLDDVSQRVAATAKLGRFLRAAGDGLEIGQPVEIMVAGRSPDALTVIIDREVRGSLYPDEQIEPLNIGDVRKGFVKQIRAKDGKVAVSLRPQGYQAVLGERDRILSALRDAGGSLPLSDNSSPQEIQRRFGLSKGAFKKVLGALYRDGLIELSERETRLR
jgi:predicted RNA-binding protein (virulence factor B family)